MTQATIKFLIGGIFVFLCGVLNAQIPKQVYDFPEYNDGVVAIQNFVQLDGKAYYLASGSSQFEMNLYATDGTAAGSSQVTQAIGLTFIGATPDFAIYKAVSGTDLQVLKGGTLSLLSLQTTASASKLYFGQQNNSTGNIDVWVTDGSNAGTKQVVSSIGPGGFYVFDDAVYYQPLYATELKQYKNGVTTSVGQLSGPGQSVSFMGNTTAKLFFSFNGVIYAVDGTNLVTVTSWSGSYSPSSSYGDKFYYVDGGKLYVTHGAEGDPAVVAESLFDFMYTVGITGGKIVWSSGVIDPLTDTFTPIDFSRGQVLTPDPSRNYFYVLQDSACSTKLFRYNVSDLSKTLVTELAGKAQGLSNAFNIKDKTLFAFAERWHGLELFVTDGTSAGTKLVVDTNLTTLQTNVSNWTDANGELYFYTYSSSNRALYSDLWSLDSLTDAVHLEHSFCTTPIAPAIFKDEIYFADNGAVAKIVSGTGAVVNKFKINENFHPYHILAGDDALFVGMTPDDAVEEVYGTNNGENFNDIGMYSLRMANMIGSTLYQLNQTNEGLELNKSQGIASPLVNVCTISPEPFSAVVTAFGEDRLLLANELGSTETLYYIEGADAHQIIPDLGGNGFMHYNNYIQYGDTIYFRVLNISGHEPYYRFIAGMTSPEQLFQTSEDVISSLIGASESGLYYIVRSSIVKFDFATAQQATLTGPDVSGYGEVHSSFRVGKTIVFIDELERLTIINTTNDNVVVVASNVDYNSIFISGENIYYARSGVKGLFKIEKINVITGIVPEVQPEIGVYPNPSSGKFHVSADQISVTVLSADGKKISDFGIVNEFDISQFPAGLYIAKLSKERGSVYYRKIIKE